MGEERVCVYIFVQRNTKAKGNVLLVLLDVTDVVTTHRTRPHVTDEGKQLIF